MREIPRLPRLPDDIIHQIFRFLPTKSAVRMRCVSKHQFQDVWSIDLDEGDRDDVTLDDDDRHTDFINSAVKALESRESHKHVDRFRLRMMRYSTKDHAVIDRFLNFAFKRNVMILDLSLRSLPGVRDFYFLSGLIAQEHNHITSLSLEHVTLIIGHSSKLKLPFLKSMSLKSVVLDFDQQPYHYYGSEKENTALSYLLSSCPVIQNLSLYLEKNTGEKCYLSIETIMDMKHLTSLHLENMEIRSGDDRNKDSRGRSDDDNKNLPLQTMILKAVDLKSCSNFSGLISSCPVIEYLSFDSCSFPSEIQVSSPSLTTLEVIDCNGGQQLNFYEARNLESFTCLVSESAPPQHGSEVKQLARTALHDCGNLKHVNVSSVHLETVILDGCRDCVDAAIDTPNLRYFGFTGNLESAISMEAPNLLDATISLLRGNCTAPPWRDFDNVLYFLKRFDHSKRIIISIDDAEMDFFFPERFRKSLSCPLLPSLKFLVVYRKADLKAKDSDLRDSMLWMAPCAEIEIKDR